MRDSEKLKEVRDYTTRGENYYDFDFSLTFSCNERKKTSTFQGDILFNIRNYHFLN